MPRPTTTLAMAATGLLVLLAAAPAHAAVDVAADPSGDSQRFANHSDTIRTAARDARADIVRIRTTHNERAVVVKVRMRDLVRGEQSSHVRIRTNASEFGAFYSLHQVDGEWVTSLNLGEDYEVDCAGLRARHSFERDVVRIAVPRTCLRNPRWVRTGWLQMFMTGPGDARTFDDARVEGDADPNTATLGRRVRVG